MMFRRFFSYAQKPNQVSPEPETVTMPRKRLSEEELRQTLQRAEIEISDMICALKREKYRSAGQNADVYLLIDDVIWQLEALRSMCDQAW